MNRTATSDSFVFWRSAVILELEQLLARYAAATTMDDIDAVIEVCAPGGWYSASGDRYSLEDVPRVVAAATNGPIMTGTPCGRTMDHRSVRSTSGIDEERLRPTSCRVDVGTGWDVVLS